MNCKLSTLLKMIAVVVTVAGLTQVFAGPPLFTFTPLTETNIVVPMGGTAVIQYLVTNQSTKPHTLQMSAIQGVTQLTSGNNICPNPFILEGSASCVLSLSINGSQIPGLIVGGPVVCQTSNLCYRPSEANNLRISRSDGPTPPFIGQLRDGGIVACLGGGLNNLVTAEQSGEDIWSIIDPFVAPSAFSTTDGATNTANIVSFFGSAPTYAAFLCSDYSIDSQGNSPCIPGNICYDDWFLPARDQLNCLYSNREAIGGFDPVDYWNSTQSWIDPMLLAGIQNFGTGIQGELVKTTPLTRFRCTRALTF